MAKTEQSYLVNTAGWIAGRYVKKDALVQLTARAAAYENVHMPDEGAAVVLTGSLDDPMVKSSGLAKAAEDETKKRSRAKS